MNSWGPFLLKTDTFGDALIMIADATARNSRTRGIDLPNRRILLSRFAGSIQATDLTLPPNCDGLGRIHHFRTDQGPNWPNNPLPIVPASRALNLPVEPVMQAQVFQSAICSWRCWYCFVDYKLLNGDARYSEWKSAAELLDLLLADGVGARVLDLSGGQPDLFPEWPVWFIQEVKRRGLEGRFYIWSDDNLSNEFLWEYLSHAELELLASTEWYGRVGCFKGFDEDSFVFNTRAPAEQFERQFAIMGRLWRSGIDVFGYVTLTSDNAVAIPQRISGFIDRLQERVHPRFPLRVVPLRIREFAPTAGRLNSDVAERALRIQDDAVAVWKDELARRFRAVNLWDASTLTPHP